MGRKAYGTRILTGFTIKIGDNQLTVSLDKYEAIKEKDLIKDQIQDLLKQPSNNLNKPKDNSESFQVLDTKNEEEANAENLSLQSSDNSNQPHSEISFNIKKTLEEASSSKSKQSSDEKYLRLLNIEKIALARLGIR